VARLSRALARRQVVVASHAAGQGRGQIWLELHVAQGSPLACLVWFGVCSQPASAEGCTLDLPHSPGASITINHRHMYLLRTMALGRLGKKAAPLAGIVTLPSPSASASAYPALPCPVLDVRPAPTRRSVRSPHHHSTLALTLEPGSRRLKLSCGCTFRPLLVLPPCLVTSTSTDLTHT
jgi:hypothetical protein